MWDTRGLLARRERVCPKTGPRVSRGFPGSYTLEMWSTTRRIGNPAGLQMLLKVM